MRLAATEKLPANAGALVSTLLRIRDDVDFVPHSSCWLPSKGVSNAITRYVNIDKTSSILLALV